MFIIGAVIAALFGTVMSLYLIRNEQIKKQNQELKEINEKLSDSETNFRIFFETMDDMIFIANQSGEIFFTNDLH